MVRNQRRGPADLIGTMTFRVILPADSCSRDPFESLKWSGRGDGSVPDSLNSRTGRLIRSERSNIFAQLS